MHILVKLGTQPAFANVQPMPFALKDQVVKKWEKLKTDGIVKRLTKGDWVAPLVVALERGGAGL